METRTSLSLQEAADAVGRNKSTIQRAIKKGTISATRDAHGAYHIEPTELFRAFDPVDPETDEDEAGVAFEDPSATTAPGRNEALAAELKLWRERFDMTGAVHGKEVMLLQSRIEELMRDREDLREERDKLLTTLQEQATTVRLLSAPPAPAQDSAALGEAGQHRGLFSWLRRRA